MNNARQEFERMRDEKAKVLHPKQAAKVALNQIVRDARNGAFDMAEVIEIVIAEECRCGATPEAARITAKNLSEGKAAEFHPRDLGAKNRQRTYPASPAPIDELRSAELSALANGTLNTRGRT